MKNHISTASLPEAQRYGYWSEVVNQYFVKLNCRLEPFTPLRPSSGLEAQLKHSPMGALDLLEVKAHPQTVTRLAPRRNDHDYFLFSLQLEGDCEIIQDDRKITIKPGEMALYDTRRPYQVSLRDEFHMCSLRIPTEIMRLHLPNPERLVARPLAPDTFIGRVLGNLVRSLFDDQNNLSADQESVMARSVIEVLSLGLQSLNAHEGLVQTSRLCQFHLDRIKHAIECNLGDPDLGVEQLSRDLKMSQSSIHRAFESEPFTVTEYIWIQRLEICKKALANPRLNGRSISEIAYNWGFASNAHFSRAFKRYTGQNPRDFKASSPRV
ncbi:AraC-type DNA-binding protein [Collimonas sp. OK607]|uniref:AraC-like ligand-binding domain-containing protein n=1 Tax=Collimonas sp. OK607 TaxID=1798194 RepID=UPI0008E06681|nr:helix-turn-helix domain-containing protein [Collimonas sp. OK607]SFB00650.1 AraC-type DNA-binding protein [Collimonas sp. OK607]